MEHKGTKELISKRLILRPFQASDDEAMFDNWASDDEVTKYLTWPTHKNKSVTKQVIDQWIKEYEKKDFYHWAIVPKDLQEPIGSLSVGKINEKTNTMHIGYCIGKKWWHQGYATEALQTLLSFLFLEVKCERVESQHDPRNAHSGAVMIKCGMSYEGTLRKADWNNQGIVDASMYSILACEYIKKDVSYIVVPMSRTI